MEREGATLDHHQEEVKVVPLIISTEEIFEQTIGYLNATQIFQSILTSLSPFFESVQTFISIYAHVQPTWHCTSNHPTSCIANKSNLCNLSRNQWVWDSRNKVHTSIISEWELECANSFITGLPGTSYFAGCLLGGLVLSTLGDSSLGRKNLLCVSSLILYLAGLASAFAPNIWVYSIFRFLSGVGRAPLPMCAIILFTERVSKKWRSQIVMLGFISASLGLLVLTGIGYLLRESSWRSLYLWTSIPGLIYTIVSYFFMYESPRWLLLQGRNQDAIDVLTSLGGPKSRQMSPSLDVIIKYTEQKAPDNNITSSNPYATLKVLMSKSWAAKRLMASMLLAFGIGLMYFGMFLGVGSLGSNIYLTSVYHSILSLSSSFLAFLVCIPMCNRRTSLIGFCALSGAMSITLSIISKGEVRGILLGIELVSMFSACMAYNMVMLYIVELFPTCVRSSASQLVRQATNLGTVLDPMLVLLGSGNMLYSYGVFGLAMLLCGFLVICLPETRDKVLCDTMEEQEIHDNEKNEKILNL